MRYVDTEPHAITRIVSASTDKALHVPEGKRFPVPCHCHGHCAECRGPVVMDKAGKYRHVR